MYYTEEHIQTDFLIIGGGVAGLRAAIELARNGDVLVVTKDAPSESSSEYAQGGVAVALSDEDEISIHLDDTLRAGDGLCLRKAVGTLVEEGPTRIRELILWGAEFDKEGTKLAFTQEAAHSKRRILHAQGDSTGHEIMRVLIDKVRSSDSVSKIDFAFTRDLIIQDGRCVGAVVCQQALKKVLVISARAVLLATGGAGQLYERTTNPAVATGDGMAMAYRAGAELVDMEFVQFHPTALFLEGAPQFLLSEAMRGEGGMLRNVDGHRFMDALSPGPRTRPARRGHPRDPCGNDRNEVAPRISRHDALERRVYRKTFSAHLPDLQGLRHRHFPRTDPGIARGPLHYGRSQDRPLGRHERPGPLCCRRDGLHRRPRREPPCEQFAARRACLRRAGGTRGLALCPEAF